MPYLSLTLAGQPVDLPADAAVALSYRANDLRRLDSREAAFSEQFTLPLTANNAAVLGAPHVLDSQSLSPYRLLPAVLTSPGGTELLRGFAILEASQAGYEITLTDAIGGLFTQVGDRSLRSLNMGTLDHTFSMPNVQAGQLHDYTQGYCYVLTDDGRLTVRNPATGILWYELTLAAFYHAVLLQIMVEALPGYRITGSLLADPTYRLAVLPRATNSQRLRPAITAPYAVTVVNTVAQAEHDNGSGKYYPLVNFQQQVAGNVTKWNGTQFSTPPFSADIHVTAHLLIRLDGSFTLNTLRSVVAVRVINSTTNTATSIHEQVIFDGIGLSIIAPHQPAGFAAVDFDFTLPFCPANQQLSVQLRLETGGAIIIAPGSSFAFSVGNTVYPGAPVCVDATLPDISRADFLKLLFNQFNVVLQADPNTKIARFDLFNDLEKRRNQAVDWSAKVDFTTRPRLVYRLGDYAQKNSFLYEKPPKEYAALTLGLPLIYPTATGFLAVNNTTLPKLAETYAAPVGLPVLHPALHGAATLPYLPQMAEVDLTRAGTPYSPTITYRQDDVCVYGGVAYHCLLTGVPAGTPPTVNLTPVGAVSSGLGSTTLPVIAWEIRPYTTLNDELPMCALLAAAPALPGISVVDDAPSTTAFPALTTITRTGLGFDTLLSVYHEGLRRALDPARLITVPVRLNPLDIANLDFTRPVRLNIPHVPGYGQMSGLFYLNDVDQYKPGSREATPVTLLAMGDAVPALAPAVTVPIYVPAAGRRALLLESGAPLLLENGQPIYLES